MRILVADDEEIIRTVFRLILSRRFPKSKVDAVANGAEAVESFRRDPYDAIVMDYCMPEKNGYQACVEIREICRQGNLKLPFVVFCTGYVLPPDMNQLLSDKSHYALIEKPMTNGQILEAFDRIFASHNP